MKMLFRKINDPALTEEALNQSRKRLSDHYFSGLAQTIFRRGKPCSCQESEK